MLLLFLFNFFFSTYCISVLHALYVRTYIILSSHYWIRIVGRPSAHAALWAGFGLIKWAWSKIFAALTRGYTVQKPLSIDPAYAPENLMSTPTVHDADFKNVNLYLVLHTAT